MTKDTTKNKRVTDQPGLIIEHDDLILGKKHPESPASTEKGDPCPCEWDVH